MKIRILFRQIMEVPPENREKQTEMEHRSDLCAVRLGLPVPMRMRPFTGNMDSRIRIQEYEYESIADYTRLFVECTKDPEWAELEREWEGVYTWRRQEILYVDDARDPIIPWIQMAAEQGRTIRYTVNPNYKMPDKTGSEEHAK